VRKEVAERFTKTPAQAPQRKRRGGIIAAVPLLVHVVDARMHFFALHARLAVASRSSITPASALLSSILESQCRDVVINSMQRRVL